MGCQKLEGDGIIKAEVNDDIKPKKKAA